MARVKCVMMQRDETLLLEAWFRYYGYLFGYENLVVFDNGSIEPSVHETLEIFEKAGCRILREHTRVEDFHSKGIHARNIMAQWDTAGDYDFALPVDCDEFLAVFTQGGLDCRRTAIHAEFDRLIGEKSALGFDHCLYNVPSAPGRFWADRYPKTFLAVGTAAEIDHGFHACQSKVKPGVRGTAFTYLHMHNKPFDLLKEHAARKLEKFVDIADRRALRRYTGPGLHLVPYFFMSERKFLSSYDSKTQLDFPGFGLLLRALDVRSSFFGTDGEIKALSSLDQVTVSKPSDDGGTTRKAYSFAGEAYLRKHEDVRNSGWPPLSHYLNAGAAEGRSLE